MVDVRTCKCGISVSYFKVFKMLYENTSSKQKKIKFIPLFIHLPTFLLFISSLSFRSCYFILNFHIVSSSPSTVHSFY